MVAEFLSQRCIGARHGEDRRGGRPVAIAAYRSTRQGCVKQGERDDVGEGLGAVEVA
jgi:hypothetical protein